MYLEWMGKNRAFVEKFIRYANTYAAVYKKRGTVWNGYTDFL